MSTAAVILATVVLLYVIGLLWFRDPETRLQFSRDDLTKIPLRVTAGFLWGSATSSHQVEGGCTNNNWFQFESSTKANGQPRILNGQKADLAADHWNRYRDDIQLMKALSLNAYRFSVEWSKIEPREGDFDNEALSHYSGVVRDLRAAGIEPMLTLHHFTNPIWFEERGAFLQEDAHEIFGRFVQKVVERLGADVTLWMTINEPSVYALNGHYFGDFPPGEHNPRNAARVLRNILRSHTEAYRVIKLLQPEAQVGLAINFFVFDPPSSLNLLDVVSARLITRNINESLLRYLRDGVFHFGIPGVARESYNSGISDAFDYIGLNYYTRFRTRISPFVSGLATAVHNLPEERCTDMGWEIYPQGLYRALKVLHLYTLKPIYITENGIADASDTKRARFIEDHLLVMNKAIADGINVRGYFYWSLLDNFEWALGFTKRFGLYHVNFATQERTLYEGSRVYPALISKFRSQPDLPLVHSDTHT
jgi:beta-glucosidase